MGGMRESLKLPVRYSSRCCKKNFTPSGDLEDQNAGGNEVKGHQDSEGNTDSTENWSRGC